jgi:rRNA maturation RNase YbeY
LAVTFKNNHPVLDVQISSKVSQWLKKAIQMESFLLGKLHYTFLSDDALHTINVDFLDHDTYTDIITFDYNRGNYVIGEIYISLDRVEENAKLNSTSFENELNRIIIHGLLHLLGYKDKSPNEKSIMTSKEDYYLSLLPQN